MRLVGLSLVVALSAVPATAGASIEYASASGVFPNQVCPAWELVDTSTYDALFSGGKLVLQTSSTTHNLGYLQHAPVVDFSKTRTIEARLRYVSGSTTAANRAPVAIMFTTTPNVGNTLFIDRDRMFLLDAPDNLGPAAFVDTDDAFHTYKLEIEPAGAIRVFYDGVLQFTGSTYSSSGNNGATPRVGFGELSVLASGRSEWEFVRHDAVAPGAANCLAAWWRAENNALDSARTHHGTLLGETRFDAGICDGRAFSFDGYNDGVAINRSAGLDKMANFSFDAWVSFRAIPTGTLQFVMAKGLVAGPRTSAYALWLNANGTMSAAVESATQLNTASGSEVMVAGRLYHMAVTYDGANIRLYIDGALKASAPLTGIVREISYPVYLGRRAGAGVDGGGDSMNGTLDEARIWLRALSASEVRAAYYAGCGVNAPPVADAGADQSVECSGLMTTVTLDGSGSNDANDTELTYEWFEGATLVGSGVTAEVTLPAGNHAMTLVVTDPAGVSSEDTVNVAIADTTPPLLTAPAAITRTSCSSFISDPMLGNATATDLCSDHVDVVRSGVPAGHVFPIGTTTITYTARDAAGNQATATQLVTITQAPPVAISNVSVTPARIWPANHKMVDVFVGYDVAGGCGGLTASLSVSSSDGNAKGDVTAPDWVIVDRHNLQLRAERAPTARERVYTITITARDVTGSESSRSVTVRVSPDPTGR